MSPARLWLGMAATQLGGRRPGAGRPRFVPAASKRPARAVLKLDSTWSTLKQRGGFHSDSQFVAHLLSLEEVYTRTRARSRIAVPSGLESGFITTYVS